MFLSFFGSVSEEVFKAYANAGIDWMEISLPCDAYDALNYDQIAFWAKKHGIGLWSIHLPFSYECNIANPNKDRSDQTVERHLSILKKASEIGVRYAVIHPSGEPNEEKDRKVLLERASENLGKLCAFADGSGMIVAVEDLPRSCLGNCAKEIMFFLERNPSLRVCFDTNHLTNDDNMSFVKAVGSKIVTLHVSDYDFIDERHALPGEGKIMWQELILELKNVHYNGAFFV